MAIKDKDGKVFKLSGPNPIMRNQTQWEKDRTKLFNMDLGQTTEVIASAMNPVDKFKTDYDVLDIGEELGLVSNEEFMNVITLPTSPPPKKQEPIHEIKVEVVKPEPEQEEKKPVTINLTETMARNLQKQTVKMYFAPASYRVRRDDFYGTEHKIITYGKKDIMDAIIADQSDLELQFWAVRAISVGSIVFPITTEALWWRIEGVEPKSGGFLYKAFVSDVNPDFS